MFSKYTDSLLTASTGNPRLDDVSLKKQEILTGISEFHNCNPSEYLFIGFSPAILAVRDLDIHVTQISDAAAEFLTQRGIKFTRHDWKDLVNGDRKFQVVVALDEYFTFASTDDQQRELVNEVCGLTENYIVTTLKDYKNQEFKNREFSSPSVIKNNHERSIFLEYHDYDIRDRNSWVSSVYGIYNDALTMFGKFERHAMFFKQLAKFSNDAGASSFLVHKNLMYKSLIRKNYEHVISIRVE